VYPYPIVGRHYLCSRRLFTTDWVGRMDKRIRRNFINLSVLDKLVWDYVEKEEGKEANLVNDHTQVRWIVGERGYA
jgi:hypothetical protein